MSMERYEEGPLLEALRAGEEAALAEIVRRYTPYVGAIVWNILQGKLSEEDAKEVTADAFYGLWRNAERVREGSLKGYLASIARSRALNALRKAGREEPLEEDAIRLTQPGPEGDLLRREEHAALQRALDSLGEPDRSIFLRHYYLYQSAREIGERMGIKRNTVMTRLRRGRQRLREELTKGGFTLDPEDLGDV